MYLKLQPLKGPVGDIKVTAQVLIEYSLELEFHRAQTGTVQYLDIVIPANTQSFTAQNYYATRLHEVGIASNRGSECRGEYVPGPCTHRPSHHGNIVTGKQIGRASCRERV